jgi:hypothetical protein
MTEPPRHRFVVGVHNPEIPNPWDYALNHDFDFACTFISRPQLEAEILAQVPDTPEFNQVLFQNALLKPSGTFLRCRDADVKIPCCTCLALLPPG